MICFLRCTNCAIKTYCSRECLAKDCEEKHNKFCEEGDTEERLRDFERKYKVGRKSREEAGLKDLEQGFHEQLKLARSSEVAKMYVRTMELCKK